jgi:hypothetical protein
MKAVADTLAVARSNLIELVTAELIPHDDGRSGSVLSSDWASRPWLTLAANLRELAFVSDVFRKQISRFRPDKEESQCPAETSRVTRTNKSAKPSTSKRVMRAGVSEKRKRKDALGPP